MIEIVKTAFLHLYRINNFIFFLILTFLLVPKTMTSIIKTTLVHIPLADNSIDIFLYSYIIIQTTFFIVELLNNFISMSKDVKQAITSLNQTSQFLYIFICLVARKLLLPPFENNLILFIYSISLVAMCNQLYHKLKTIFKNMSIYPKGEILFIIIVLIWLYSTNTVELQTLLKQLHLSKWIEQLNSLP